MAKAGQLYSGFFDNPTPEAPNSEGTAAGPILNGYTRKIERPEAGKDLIIETSLVTTNAPAAEVILFYRTMFDTEKSVIMEENENGSGTYQAAIPGSSFDAAEMVRWRFEVTD